VRLRSRWITGRSQELVSHHLKVLRQAGLVRSQLVAIAASGLWWLDPVPALVVAVVAGREGVETWRGEGCCAGPELQSSRDDCGDDCCD
jgi:Bacterial regulatory protein, arsR family